MSKMARGRGVNVVRRGSLWAVVRDGARRASGIFRTQQGALNRGRQIARNERTELRTQGRNGKWRDSDSYGNDPHPPTDRKH